jgi:hypothetical protein
VETKLNVLPVLFDLQELERHCLASLVRTWQGVLTGDSPSVDQLSRLVPSIHNHIQVFERSALPVLKELSNISWEYLKRTNFQQEDGFCSEPCQGLVAILLSDVMTKMDAEAFADDHFLGDIFPGQCRTDNLQTIRVGIRADSTWRQPTGLWLPAGVVGAVTCEGDYPGITVQIGSHSSLTDSPSPWTRWPVVTQTFKMDEFPVQIASPFGGLIYFRLAEKVTGPHLIHLSITNVCRAPVYSVAEAANWRNVEFNVAPWGEIHTEYAVFTMPSESLQRAHDLSYFLRGFDKICQDIHLFLGLEVESRFHIVFDHIVTEAGSQSHDPLVLGFETIDGILPLKSFTSDLFALLMMMALCLLPETGVDPQIEVAIAALAVSHIFAKFVKNFDPADYTFVQMSPLYVELWECYQKQEKQTFPEVFGRFQKAVPGRPPMTNDEVVALLSKDLGSVMQGNISPVIDRLRRPTPDRQVQLPEYHFEPDPDE